jgi:succinate-semialdehyde dehydrogenase/glutarate-semialdehyde dehydrogenase
LGKVKHHVEDAVPIGAEVIVGGKEIEGLYFTPTVLSNATHEMIIARDEVFGILLTLLCADQGQRNPEEGTRSTG